MTSRSAREEFATTMLTWRKRAGLKQEEAGPMIGVHGTVVSRWENMRHLPEPTRVRDIAKAYGVDAAEVGILLSAASQEAKDEADKALGALGARMTKLEMMTEEILGLLRDR